MRKYEDFIEGLKGDVEVPSEVSRKVDKTLANLPDVPVGKGKNKVRKWITAIASTAAILALSSGLLIANPVLAAKIPIIGKIFERVEDNVTYSGDFKDKADVLTAEPEDAEVNVETDEAGETAEIAADTTYVVEDQGMTFTASEVYCDGHSLYLTAKVESKDGGFTNMTGYMNEEGTGERVKHMYAWGDGQTDKGIYGENTGQSLEGEVLDDNTFVGMMKLDLAQMVSEDGTFDLKLSMLGFDDYEHSESEDIDVTHRYDGSWELSIPYTVDKTSAKTIEVNEAADNGLKIDKVFVSPYQVLVYLDAPYTQPNSDSDTSREQYEELWGEKNEEMLSDGDTENVKTYEEWLNDKEYNMEWDIAIFNQDDVRLQWWDISLRDEQWVARCATGGADVSKLQIFIGDEWLNFKMANVKEAKEKATFDTVIEVK